MGWPVSLHFNCRVYRSTSAAQCHQYFRHTGIWLRGIPAARTAAEEGNVLNYLYLAYVVNLISLKALIWWKLSSKMHFNSLEEFPQKVNCKTVSFILYLEGPTFPSWLCWDSPPGEQMGQIWRRPVMCNKAPALHKASRTAPFPCVPQVSYFCCQRPQCSDCFRLSIASFF